jgi:hypothetical protein
VNLLPDGIEQSGFEHERLHVGIGRGIARFVSFPPSHCIKEKREQECEYREEDANRDALVPPT